MRFYTCPKCFAEYSQDEISEYAQDEAVAEKTVLRRLVNRGCGVAFSGWDLECNKGVGFGERVLFREIFSRLEPGISPREDSLEFGVL